MNEFKQEINTLMSERGFNLLRKDSSDQEETIYRTYARDNIGIRIVLDEEHGAIEVRKFDDEEDWFDLAVVKALLFQEDNLLEEMSNRKYFKFLERHFDHILDLFSEEHYSYFKACLLDLYDLKYELMFPDDDDEEDD